MDHSQRDSGDNPQDQTEVCCLTLQPTCRTEAGPHLGHGSDDPLRSAGAGHMDVFHVQLGQILADVQRTPDICFGKESHERISIIPPVAPGAWVILARRSSRFARRITVCVCVIRPCTTTGGRSGMPFLQKTQTTRCWMFVAAERDRSIEGSEGSPPEGQRLPSEAAQRFKT